MGMTCKRILLLALAAGMVLLLSGCRVRTGRNGLYPEDSREESVPDEEKQAKLSSGIPMETAAQEERESAEDGEPGTTARENPEAGRKEYDENAPVEIISGTDRLIHGEGEGGGAPVRQEEAGKSTIRLEEQAEEPAVQTVAAQEAEQMGVSEDAEEAESALIYFTVLLQDRCGSLFECQRVNVYWETEEDHVTIHKSAPEHTLILNAGAYDVSARLLPENLCVDNGWVLRKNPQVIVKIVDSSILGRNVQDSGKARAVCQHLMNREGWTGIDAIRNRQVLLLSRELLEAPYLQTAVMLMIAGTAYPDLMADVDTKEALRMIAEEATGMIPAGIYEYSAREDGI